MNKLNTLFEAMNDIDDNIVANAVKTRKKRPIALIVAAAAAVSILALTGYADKNDEYRPEGKDVMIEYSDGSVFGFDLSTFDIAIPDQYKPDSTSSNLIKMSDCTTKATGVLPSELFEAFGLTMLTSDNFIEFSENFELETLNRYDYINDAIIKEFGPPVYVYGSDGIEFWYHLYDKNTQRLVSIQAHYCTTENYSCTVDDGETCKYKQILTLKDGSKCRVTENNATFAYEGVVYQIDMWCPEYGVDWNYKDDFIKLKQVIKDLGILA